MGGYRSTNCKWNRVSHPYYMDYRRPGRFSRRMVLVVSRIPSGEFRGLAAVCFNKYDLAAIGRSIDRERSSASQMESSKRGNRP